MAKSDELSEQVVEIEWVGGEMPTFLRDLTAEAGMQANGHNYRYKIIGLEDGLIHIEHDVNHRVRSGNTIGAVWVPLTRIAAIRAAR